MFQDIELSRECQAAFLQHAAQLTALPGSGDSGTGIGSSSVGNTISGSSSSNVFGKMNGLHYMALYVIY